MATPPGSDQDDQLSNDEVEDLAYNDLDTFPDFLLPRAEEIKSLRLEHNLMMVLPRAVGNFMNLVSLDVSNNNLTYISPEIVRLKLLRTLNFRGNALSPDSLPKDFGLLASLQVLNLSGNQLTEIPPQITELSQLRCLKIGGNRITQIPPEISNLHMLEVLYLGGNRLSELPEEIGYLQSLVSLNLCDNNLQFLPRSTVHLRRLQSLSLHNNQLSTLPPELVRLNLVELSLRNNPLVVKFVQDMMYEPPSLLELAGRVVKIKNITYTAQDLPRNLIEYLKSAQSCVNPKCRGVYFTSCVEHIKFVDFCGKYRVPLLEYLCSPSCKKSPIIACSSGSESSEEEDAPVVSKMKKVLLG